MQKMGGTFCVIRTQQDAIFFFFCVKSFPSFHICCISFSHRSESRPMMNGGTGETSSESSMERRQDSTTQFRKRREKSAMILITIVLTFLFCHTFRFVLKAYEVANPYHSTAEYHIYCHNQSR